MLLLGKLKDVYKRASEATEKLGFQGHLWDFLSWIPFPAPSQTIYGTSPHLKYTYRDNYVEVSFGICPSLVFLVQTCLPLI